MLWPIKTVTKKQYNSLYRKTVFPVKNYFLCYYSVNHFSAMPQCPGVDIKPCAALPLTATWHLLGFLAMSNISPCILFHSSVCHTLNCSYIMQSFKHEWGINWPTREPEWDSSVKRNRIMESVKSQVESVAVSKHHLRFLGSVHPLAIFICMK